MKRFAIRNYGPTRQVPYKDKQLYIANDGCVETDDAGEAAAFAKVESMYVTDSGVAVVAPEASKEERKVTVDDVEAVHDEKFPPETEENKSQETGGTQPPAPESKADKDEIAYADMSYKEIQVLAKDRQIKSVGVKKAKLIKALKAYDNAG